MAQEQVSTTKGALIAGGFLAAMTVMVLCICDILPKWIFQTVYLILMSALWFQLVRQVWEKIPSRKRGWFYFWNYALPWVCAASIASGVLFEESRWERVLGKLTAAVTTGICVALIYNFIYKNKTKMRKKIVAGNWKMNTLPAEGVELAKAIVAGRGEVCSCVDFIVCPPFTHLSQVAEAIKGSAIALGAQDCATEAKGAYTGEIAASMLAALGCKYVILGHSERRQYYGETSATLNKKMAQAYANGLIPIYCVGESLEERQAEKHFEVVKAQIEEVVFNLTAEQFAQVVIAYEPVWAIGTGLTATAEQAQEIQAYIRKVMASKFGAAAAETPILYGGSCKPSNAAEIFAKEDVDGGLIGGAALAAGDFLGIGKGFAK